MKNFGNFLAHVNKNPFSDETLEKARSGIKRISTNAHEKEFADALLMASSVLAGDLLRQYHVVSKI